MASESRDYALIDKLAEEFAARIRNGEEPNVEEYCGRFPDAASDLRAMLPALVEVEQVGVAAQAATELPKLRQIGEYTILREIGRGGMGVVYEAEQVTLGRRVALKVLAGGKSGSGLERFRREARAAARLHHTNIVPVFGVGEHEGLPYYVMQFIQGLGLDAVLEEVKRLQPASSEAPRTNVAAAEIARSFVTGNFESAAGPFAPTQTHESVGQVSNLSAQNGQVGNLSHNKPASSSSISLPGQSTSGRKPTYWESVAQIGLQVADAIDYAHKQGILHRDIKPSNLLLDLHGVVWITDFGLAKATDQEDLTNTGDILGTLRYMPPEALEGRYDSRGDVYSLGLSLYELLALRPAYSESSRQQLIKAVATAQPTRLALINPNIPRDVQTIVHKAIEKDPKHRYQAAGELAADLRRFLSNQPILARRTSAFERFSRWCKRNPVVAGLSGAIAFLLIAAVTTLSILTVKANRHAAETVREKERADANLYIARMNLIQSDWDNGNIGRVLESLRYYGESEREHFRGFEWHYWNRRVHGEQLSWQAHRSIAWDLEYSPNGKWLASTGYGEIKLWDASKGAEIRAWKFDRGDSPRIAFSPDGRRLAAIDSDRLLRVWNLETGGEIFNVSSGQQGSASTELAFNPDGSLIATVESGGELRLLNSADGTLKSTLRGADMLRCLGWSPNGKQIAAGTASGRVILWDPSTPQPIATIYSHSSEVRGVAFVNEGRDLLSTGLGGPVKVWGNVPDAKGDIHTPRLELPSRGAPIDPTVIAANETHLATCGEDRQIHLWDVKTFQLLKSIKGHANIVTSLTFHPNGKQLAASDADGQVKVWPLVAENWPLNVELPSPGHGVDFNADGDLLATVTTPTYAKNAEKPQTIRIIESATGRIVRDIAHPESDMNCVAISPDGQRVAAGCGQTLGVVGEIRVWNRSGGTPVVLGGFTGGVVRVMFSGDGQRLLSASQRDVIVWDLSQQRQIVSFPASGSGIGFTRDGRLAAVGASDRVEIWNVDENRAVRTLNARSARYGTGSSYTGLGQLAFSADGQSLAAPDDHGKVWLWNLSADHPPLELNGHTSAVLGLAFTPDGKRLATASRDRQVKLWDVASGQEILVLKDHKDGVAAIAFNPDGFRLATAGLDKAVRIWDVRPLGD